jgi:hypothetical protein
MHVNVGPFNTNSSEEVLAVELAAGQVVRVFKIKFGEAPGRSVD